MRMFQSWGSSSILNFRRKTLTLETAFVLGCIVRSLHNVKAFRINRFGFGRRYHLSVLKAINTPMTKERLAIEKKQIKQTLATSFNLFKSHMNISIYKKKQPIIRAERH